MGGALSTATEKVGGFLANIISSPVKNFFGKTCEDKCGDWDGVCYIENGCVASLIRLLKACGLLLITVLFLYIVLWKTGLVKCLVKKSCKLSWKACWGCFHGLGSACAFLWYKLRNTKRVYRGRRAQRAQVEMTGISWSGSTSGGSSRKRGRSPVHVRERWKDRVRQPVGPASKQVDPHHHNAKRSRAETEQSPHHHHHHRATGMARHDHGRVHRARQH